MNTLKLTKEMIDWLNLSDNRGLWLPSLKYLFSAKFGHQKTGKPDSLSSDDAGSLVDDWDRNHRAKEPMSTPSSELVRNSRKKIPS